MLSFQAALTGLVWGTVWTLNARLEDRLIQRIDRLENNINNRLGIIEPRLDSFGWRIARNEARLDAR